MGKNRNVYSASFKAQVAIAAVKQEKTLSQLASQFNVHPLVVSRIPTAFTAKSVNSKWSWTAIKFNTEKKTAAFD
jgi:hypothetical protein